MGEFDRVFAEIKKKLLFWSEDESLKNILGVKDVF